jgi:hypothetical protein
MKVKKIREVVMARKEALAQAEAQKELEHAAASLPVDVRIRNLRTLGMATEGRFNVARVYFYMTLDPLIEISRQVAADFVKRPHVYTDVGGGDVARALAALHYQYGNNEYVLSADQRRDIYLPLFGYRPGDMPVQSHDFVLLRDQLNEAARAFAERVFSTGADMLRERVRVAHRPFQEYIEGLRGDSLNWSVECLDNLVNALCHPLFRNPGIAGVFGLSSPAAAEWPYLEDANGSKMVEETSRKLSKEDNPTLLMTRERFSTLQRIALRGAEAIVAVCAFDEGQPDEQLMSLITKCYTWGSSLKDFEASKPNQ